VPEFTYTLTEHDPEQAGIVVGSEHYVVSLDANENFFIWAHERWPEPRWLVALDDWQL
jgi:hypothetical protein